MGTKVHYKYGDTGIFIGEETLQKDPLGDGFIMPNGRYTETPPPGFKDNELVLFDGNIWSTHEAIKSGEWYSKSSGEKALLPIVENIEDFTDVPPLDKFNDGTTQEFINGEWVYTFKGEGCLEAEKQTKISDIIKNRKTKQDANLTTINGNIIYGTQIARDNLFKVFILNRDEMDKSWLDVNGDSFMMTFLEAEDACNRFEERNSALYHQEAIAIQEFEIQEKRFS